MALCPTSDSLPLSLLQAIFQAGLSIGQPAPTAVAVGIASAEYNNYIVPRFTSGVSAYSATGGALSVASGRLSYTFAFKGPAVSVDTACSSSLVATHVAASNLWGAGTGCTGALAAGVGLLLSPDTTSMFHKAGMLAADGRCKTLDQAADGYVRGEACGVMVLQAGTAQRALAMYRGSAVNQDGRSSSLTAPNGPSQQEAIRAALQMGCLLAGEVTHLQMHGTGTPLGDPIEVGAAAAVLMDGAKRPTALAASTAKAWIGHTEAAAGITGLTHAAMGLSHQLTHGRPWALSGHAPNLLLLGC
jgi:acyl transferase domain-containing protein